MKEDVIHKTANGTMLKTNKMISHEIDFTFIFHRPMLRSGEDFYLSA